MSILLSIVKIFHNVFIFFQTVGCLLPVNLLIYHVFLWPLVYLHWFFNDGNCILRTLELKLGDEEFELVDKWPGIRRVLPKHITLNDDQVEKIVFAIATIAWSISLARLTNVV